MKTSDKERPLVIAGGGIVTRGTARPLIAIVRLRKDKHWVLPKGKLKAGEDVLAAAQREVTEETGHEVTVHEFIGSMSHTTESSLKVVQFWRMSAADRPTRRLTDDIKDMKWLSLSQAVDTLTRPHERAFLAHVGPDAIAAARAMHRRVEAPPTAPAIEASDAADSRETAPERPSLMDMIRIWFRRLTHA